MIAGVTLALLLAGGSAVSVAALPPAPQECTPSLRQSIAFGAATAAYQVEGGWSARGKGPSIWDRYVRSKAQGGCGCVAENATGDVAADHFSRFREDVELMRSLGVKHYRFSVSWPRVLPQGGKGTPISAEGVGFYKALVRDLRAAGIAPVATLYHWDLPQALQDKYGGFLAADPTVFAEDFAYYADVAFRELGGELRGGGGGGGSGGGVDEWITFNEPISICSLGYGTGLFAPGIKGGKQGEHRCGHALLLAHAAAARVYNGKHRAKSGGKGRLSIALDGKWGRPWSSSSPADAKAADSFTLFQFGWMADPLYFGDYPAEMRRAYDSASGAELPAFTEEQKAELKAARPDALSLNFYTSYWVKAPAGGVVTPGGKIAKDGKVPFDVTYGNGPGGAKIGPVAASSWLFVTPDAFGRTLEWLSRRYGSPEIWVTENGVSVEKEDTKEPPAVLRDAFRVNYFDGYLRSMCRALAEGAGKVRVTKYFAWSLMDNLEWLDGYTKRFGIVWVDYKGGSLRREPKDSARYLSQHFFTKGRQ